MIYNRSQFLALSLIILLLMVNFFLTQSPFSAMHSGKITNNVVEGYFIVPAYLILFGMIFAFIYKFNFKINIILVIFIFLSLISGLVNGFIIYSFKSYFYDVLILFLIATVFQYTPNQITIFDTKNSYKIILNLSLLFVVIGFFVAIFFPQRYGYLPFEFSRETRGQVTLWLYSSLYFIFPILSIIAFVKYNLKSYLIFSFFINLVIISTASRAPFLISIIPIIILLYYYKRKLALILGFMVVLLSFFIKSIIDFIKNIFYVEDFSNGRDILWEYYWNNFLEAPFFGKGLSFMQYYGDYYGKAESEIGLLKVFTERGLLFGFFAVFIFIISLYMAHSNLKNIRNLDNFSIFMSFVFLSLVVSLFQSYSRIYSFDDFLFWCSSFYLFSQWCTRFNLKSLKVEF